MQFRTFKDLTMNSSNTADDQTLSSRDDELDILLVAVVVGASKSDEQSRNQTPGPPVEVFTTTVSNVLQRSVAKILNKSGTLYSIRFEKIY